MSRYDWKECEFSVLVGKKLVAIEGLKEGSEEVVFVTSEGERYHMYHERDCCESVQLVDVDGLEGETLDANGEEVRVAEVATFDASNVGRDDSETWTFYKLTVGWNTVILRWCGSSNGYYSEGVNFRLEPNIIEPGEVVR